MIIKPSLILKQYLIIIVLIFNLCSCSDTPLKKLKQSNLGIISSAISSDSHYAAVASINHDTAVWDLEQKKYLYSLQHNKNKIAEIVAMKFSPNGKYLLTAERRNIVLWQTSTGKPLVNYTVNSDIQDVALSNQSNLALLGLQNATALLISLETGQPIKSFSQTETINTVALSENGKYALTGSDDHLAVLWDIAKTKVIYKFKHNKRVMHVGFSPDLKTILTSASLDKVRLWDRDSGELKSTLGHRRSTVSSFKFSNDSSFLALGTVPQMLQLWSIAKDSPVMEQQWLLAKPSFWRPSATIINSIAFTDNNQQLITDDSNGYALWWQIK